MTTPEDHDPAAPVADLLRTLDLTPLGSTVDAQTGDPDLHEDVELFEGSSQPQPHGRVYGGQVLAQCVMAAGRTVEAIDADGPRFVHSLHGYFLRPGDSTQPIRFAVERLRDGRSFSARRVHAMQEHGTLMSMILSFQEEADGIDHQDSMPAAPRPERLPTISDELGGIDHPMVTHWSRRRAVDIRHVEDPIYLTAGDQPAASQSIWMRVPVQLPDDPLLHAAVLAYSSDYTLLESSLRRHRLAWSDSRLRAASLDHAMWFHRRPRADDWVLYTQQSPSASGGRGLGVGRMFATDGTLLATVAQEGMLRLKGS